MYIGNIHIHTIPSVLKIMGRATEWIRIMIQWRAKIHYKINPGSNWLQLFFSSNVFYYTASINVAKINYESLSLSVPI